jgi:hypothetical protein
LLFTGFVIILGIVGLFVEGYPWLVCVRVDDVRVVPS